MGVAPSPTQAHSSERTFKPQIAREEIAEMAAERTLHYLFCHSQRSEESLINSIPGKLAMANKQLEILRIRSG